MFVVIEGMLERKKSGKYYRYEWIQQGNKFRTPMASKMKKKRGTYRQYYRIYTFHYIPSNFLIRFR